MDKKDQPKPTWTERAVPETVKPTSVTRHLTDDDWNTLVPASDAIVNSAYGRTGILPVRPLMSRGDVAADSLVIQKSAKQARVLNFVVENIHWRGGFAPEIGQTPLNQYIDGVAPPEVAVQGANGFVMRPASPEFDRVLRDIVPPALLRLEDEMFGRGREIGGFYLYFIPHATGAAAGAIAWYAPSATGKQHLLYLQTEVKRADARILDEMEKTFNASLVAVRSHGPIPRPFDFWEEIRDATAEVQASIKQSTWGRNAGGVREILDGARSQAENTLQHRLTGVYNRVARFTQVAFVRLPQFAVATMLRGISQAAVKIIQAVDRLLERQKGPAVPDELEGWPKP